MCDSVSEQEIEIDEDKEINRSLNRTYSDGDRKNGSTPSDDLVKGGDPKNNSTEKVEKMFNSLEQSRKMKETSHETSIGDNLYDLHLPASPRLVICESPSAENPGADKFEVVHDRNADKNSSDYFSLTSEEGQRHLSELNRELMMLNEAGSSRNFCDEAEAEELKARFKRSNRLLKRKANLNLKRKRTSSEEGNGTTSKMRADESLGLEEGMEDLSDINKWLEEAAEKKNLTVRNVKNILRRIVTNEHVLTMVRNTIKLEENEADGIEPAVFEPKLTRAKARELREKQPSNLQWVVSPVKNTSRPSSTSQKFLEEKFSESSSSDEEYQPVSEESDDDESMFSSRASGTGSPLLSPAFSVDSESLLDRSVDTSFIASPSPSEKNGTIAARTRSKLPLNDTPLESIEAQFAAPDITMDMYDTVCDDEEWKEFLQAFFKPIDVACGNEDAGDDEAEDPEYNFLEEEEDDDAWDLRDDKAVKITQRELNELMMELLDAATDECPEVDDEMLPSLRLQAPLDLEEKEEEIISAISKVTEEKDEEKEDSPSMSVQQMDQLSEQMRMHVQLLSQMCVLSSQSGRLKSYKKLSRSMLEELDKLASAQMDQNKFTFFQGVNLKKAVALAAEMEKLPSPTKTPLKMGTDKINRKCSIRPPPPGCREVIASSDVFIYPELLPQSCLYCPLSDPNKKSIFILPEDHLVAIGLEQFVPATQSLYSLPLLKLVQNFLLPVKTHQQIRIRIKNIKSPKFTDKSNPIKYYLQHNKVPQLPPWKPRKINLNNLRSPSCLPPSLLPAWMKDYINFKKRPKPPLLSSPIMPSSVVSPQSALASSSLVITMAPVMTTTSSYAVPSKVKLVPSGSPKSISFSKQISPLKQISPILKKYTHFNRRIFPMVGMKAAASPARRKLALQPILPMQANPSDPVNVSLSVNITSSLSMPKITSDRSVDLTQGTDSVQKDGLASVVEVSVPQEKVSESDKHSNHQTDNEIICNQIEGTVENDGAVETGTDSQNEMEDGEDEIQDNEGDLAALMAASSTICKKNPLLKKKNKQQRELESTLALLAPDLMESDLLKEERETLFAQVYLQKVQEALKDEEKFRKFLILLHEFQSANQKSIAKLYEEVCDILNGHSHLAEDFIGFLLPEQALECGKLSEYLIFNRVKMFMRKLEVHFSQQPQQLQKILRALNQLQKQSDLTPASLCSSLQPLLRGQSHLLEEFLLLLPNEKPPESLMTDFEEISLLESDDADAEEECFEEIALPRETDMVGSKQCPCSCHKDSMDLRMKNRIRHCSKCGIKFIDGRIFIQVGKVLKPAQVMFEDSSSPPTSNVVGKPELEMTTALSDSPLSSNPSPETEDCKDEIDETKYCQQPMVPNPEVLGHHSASNLTTKNPPTCDIVKRAVLSSQIQDYSLSPGYSEIVSFLDPVPSIPMTKDQGSRILSSATEMSSPVHEEQESLGRRHRVSSSWSREEDRILLQTCQLNGATEDVFTNIAKRLNKSTNQVIEHFQELMLLFNDQRSDDDEQECEQTAPRV